MTLKWLVDSAADLVEQAGVSLRAGLYLFLLLGIAALGSMLWALPFALLGEDWWGIAAIVIFPTLVGAFLLNGQFAKFPWGGDGEAEKPVRKSSATTLFFGFWIGALVLGAAYLVYWASVDFLNSPPTTEHYED